jgi:hypothetical protein
MRTPALRTCGAAQFTRQPALAEHWHGGIDAARADAQAN